MTDAKSPTKFKQIECSDDIRPHVDFGIFDAIANAGLRREVNHRIGQETLIDRAESINIADVATRERECRIGKQSLAAPFFQPHIVIGGKIIDAEHLRAVCKQAARDMVADEASRTCYHYPSVRLHVVLELAERFILNPATGE